MSEPGVPLLLFFYTPVNYLPKHSWYLVHFDLLMTARYESTSFITDINISESINDEVYTMRKASYFMKHVSKNLKSFNR